MQFYLISETDFEHGPVCLIRWSFSYSFLFKCWVAELYLGGQWFHYTERGNCHSSKITRAKLANGKYFLSHWRSHKRNTNKMSPQTQWLQDYRNLISHFINWVLWTWQTMGTEKHLFIGNTWNCQGACSIMCPFNNVPSEFFSGGEDAAEVGGWVTN